MDRFVWPGLWVWTALVALAYSRHSGTSWHYFDLGARLLLDGQRLHLYALHPELQIGPMAFVVAAPSTLLGPRMGAWVACVGMVAVGPLLLHSMSRLLPPTNRTRLALVGAPFLAAWVQLAVEVGHLDDVLALTFAVAAIHLVRSHPWLCAVLLGLSADCKPWALAFVPLLLAAPRNKRTSAVLLWAAVVAAAWLPFLLGDAATLHELAHFTITNSPRSVLRVLGVDDARTPFWDRPAQLALGLVVGALAVARRGPAVVLLAVIASRLMLDPGTHVYYDGTLLLAAAAFDLGVSQRRIPVVTIAALVAVHLPQLLTSAAWFDTTSGLLRCLFLLGVLVLVTRHPPKDTSTGEGMGADAVAPGPPALALSPSR